MKCTICRTPVTRTDSLKHGRGSAHAACLMLLSINLAGQSQQRVRALAGRLGPWAREVRR
jgi:hypothetical protein